MKVAIYNLNFAAMGGGERRSASLAAYLSRSYQVTLFVQTPVDREAVARLFGIDLSGVSIVPLESKDQWVEIPRHEPDVFINNSHSSTMPCLARFGIYMCMFPEGERYDLGTYQAITANSEFTAEWIRRKWGYEAEVVYSACQFMGPAAEKRKIILNVGRFFPDLPGVHHKRQNVLIEAFRAATDLHARGWELHLIGNHAAQDEAVLQQLRTAAGDLPVRIEAGVSFEQLRRTYREAALYWHATGYGSDQEAWPSKQEHFGMSIVEAMSAGAVPLAFDGGGPRETIRPGVNGYLWSGVDELVAQTRALVADEARMGQLALTAASDSRRFDADVFHARIDAIITRLVASGG